MSYTPQAPKAEFHLTYRCDLACSTCNRACFLPAQTPDMTLDDAEEFCRQAKELDWHPRIMIIGGEPTLHHDFIRFCEIARQFTGSPSRVEVWSNGYSARATARLGIVQDEDLATVIVGTQKNGPVEQPVKDIFLDPADYGESREPCGTHARYADPDCGISVDHEGYTVCCMGGAIDGVLGLGVRTKRLADLFDEDFAARQTASLCQYCGQHLGTDGKLETATNYRGTWLSPTWAAAAKRITEGRECS